MEKHKVKIYNRQAYNNSIRRLEKINAPDYVVEAYKQGHTELVNNYYKRRLANKLGFESKIVITEQQVKEVRNSKANFISEAAKKKDQEFMGELYRMSNMDILTGKRLPPNYGELVLMGTTLDDKRYEKHLKQRKRR